MDTNGQMQHGAQPGGAAKADNDAKMRRYWQRNLRYMVVLLGIWFVAGYVLSIFLVLRRWTWNSYEGTSNSAMGAPIR